MKTDNVGYFNVPALAAGKYDVKVEQTGFQSMLQQGIVLTVSQQETLNFTLAVGSTNQVVEVNTEGTVINTVDNSIGGLVTQEAVQNLPLNGRNYVDLALMEPGTDQDYAAGGVAGGAGATSFSNHGSTPWSNLFTLDGAILNNALQLNSASQTGTTLGLDGLQEFKIVGIPDATYGLVMGGQVVMASRGGTNQFHGSVFDYLRNSALDARSYFDYTYQTAPFKRLAHFSRNQFGGSLGGPIKKDKTFFHLVYEGLRSSQFNAGLATVPAASCRGNAGQVIWDGLGTQPAGSIGPCTAPLQNDLKFSTTNNSITISPVIAPLLAIYPAANLPGYTNNFSYNAITTVVENYGQARIDHTISDKDALFGRVTIDRGNYDQPFNLTLFRQSLPGVNEFLTIGETHTFSSTLLNALRLSTSRTTQQVINEYVVSPYISAQTSYVPGLPFGGWGGFDTISGVGPQTTKPSLDNLTLYTLGDDVSWTKGRHTLKIGTLLNLYRQAAGSNANANGTLTFATYSGYLQGQISQATVLTGPSGYTPQANAPNVNRYYGYSNYGFYIQDNWHVTPRLTADLGLRYEPTDTVNELNGQGYNMHNLATDTAPTIGPFITNSSLKNFSPRVGFAYDMTGDGKTAIRGGFGVYRDVGNIGSEMREALQGTPPYASTLLPAQTLTSLPLSATGGVAGRNLAGVVSYQSKAPYSLEYNLTLERQIKGFAVSATYVGLHGIHLWTRGEGNPVNPLSPGLQHGGYLPSGQPYYGIYLNSSGVSVQPPCELAGVPGVVNGVSTTTFCRTNPYYSAVILDSNGGASIYNSGELNIIRNLSHGIDFQTSYTWSRSLDDTEDMGGFEQSAAGCMTNSDPLYRRSDWGPSCFDATNKWNANLVYHTPKYNGNHFIGGFANGWFIGNIVTIQSGVPFTPIYSGSVNRSNSGVSIQNAYDDHVNVNYTVDMSGCTSLPGQTPSGSSPCVYQPIKYDHSKVSSTNYGQWFNPAMFSLGPVGQFGNASRDMLRSPAILVWNASAVKDTAVPWLGEKGNLEFRAELFNPINKPNFGLPSANVFTGTVSDLGPYSEAPLPTAGKITSMFGTNRQVQFALKLLF